MPLGRLLFGCFLRPKDISDVPAAPVLEGKQTYASPVNGRVRIDGVNKATCVDVTSVLDRPTSTETQSDVGVKDSANSVLRLEAPCHAQCSTATIECIYQEPIDSARSSQDPRTTRTSVGGNDYDACYFNPLAEAPSTSPPPTLATEEGSASVPPAAAAALETEGALALNLTLAVDNPLARLRRSTVSEAALSLDAAAAAAAAAALPGATARPPRGDAVEGVRGSAASDAALGFNAAAEMEQAAAALASRGPSGTGLTGAEGETAAEGEGKGPAAAEGEQAVEAAAAGVRSDGSSFALSSCAPSLPFAAEQEQEVHSEAEACRRASSSALPASTSPSSPPSDAAPRSSSSGVCSSASALDRIEDVSQGSSLTPACASAGPSSCCSSGGDGAETAAAPAPGAALNGSLACPTECTGGGSDMNKRAQEGAEDDEAEKEEEEGEEEEEGADGSGPAAASAASAASPSPQCASAKAGEQQQLPLQEQQGQVQQEEQQQQQAPRRPPAHSWCLAAHPSLGPWAFARGSRRGSRVLRRQRSAAELRPFASATAAIAAGAVLPGGGDGAAEGAAAMPARARTGQGLEEMEEEGWLELGEAGSCRSGGSVSMSDAVSYIFLPVLLRQGSRATEGADGEEGGMLSPNGGGDAGNEDGMEQLTTPRSPRKVVEVAMPSLPKLATARPGAPRSVGGGAAGSGFGSAAGSAAGTPRGHAHRSACACGACNLSRAAAAGAAGAVVSPAYGSPGAAVSSPRFDGVGASAADAGNAVPTADGAADCSISGLCMTRALIRRLGLLPESPASPTAAATTTNTGFHSVSVGGASPPAALPARLATSSVGGAGRPQPAASADPYDSAPASPFAAARRSAEAALLSASHLSPPPASPPLAPRQPGPPGDADSALPSAISPVTSTIPFAPTGNDGAEGGVGVSVAVGGDNGGGGGAARSPWRSSAAFSSVASTSSTLTSVLGRGSEFLLLLASVRSASGAVGGGGGAGGGGGGAGGGGGGGGASTTALGCEPAAWRPLREKYRAVRLSSASSSFTAPAAAAATVASTPAAAAALPSALAQCAWEVADEAGVEELAAQLAAEVGAYVGEYGNGDGAAAAADGGVVIVRAARMEVKQAPSGADLAARKGIVTEAEVEALWREAMAACGQGQGQGAADGHGNGRGAGLFERSELWLPLRDVVAWRRASESRRSR